MARLGIILFIDMDMQDHANYHVWIHLFFLPAMPEERRKTIGSVLELNPGPLASQATALTTGPCLSFYHSDVIDSEALILIFMPWSHSS